MGDDSKIEWTDATWNPVRGCTKISPGCANCYASTFAERFRGVVGHPYERGFDLRTVPSKLDEPLRWKRPRRIFVNSMSDLFHNDVPDDYIANVFEIMRFAAWHTFQVLTKRADRMERFVSSLQWFKEQPLPNVWLGVSAENDACWGARVRKLCQTPAAVRFVSAEPLLGPIDMVHTDPLRIDWLIIGGESGAGARSMDIGWARSLVMQARTRGIKTFVKQLGAAPVDGPHPLVNLGRKGNDPAQWPADLDVREFPTKGAFE